MHTVNHQVNRPNELQLVDSGQLALNRGEPAPLLESLFLQPPVSKRPTALAPTVNLAEPKIRKQVDRWLKLLGQGVTLLEFSRCEPCLHDVLGEDRSTKWLEGWWFARIEADRFCTGMLDNLDNGIINVDEVDIEPGSDKTIILILSLSARVMRG